MVLGWTGLLNVTEIGEPVDTPDAPEPGVMDVTVGTTWSIVTVTGAEVVLRPAASVATAVRTYVPVPTFTLFQAILYGAVVVVPITMGEPALGVSTNCTLLMPTGSDAMADRTTVLAPAVKLLNGLVRETVGGVVSVGLATLMVTGDAVVAFPAQSTARAVTV
jgi:hypothetical protein